MWYYRQVLAIMCSSKSQLEIYFPWGEGYFHSPKLGIWNPEAEVYEPSISHKWK